jgi:Tfp pilus assembly protein FimT
MLRNPRNTSRGITLIEILIVLGVLTLLISFAVPNYSDASASMQLRAAAENVQHTIDTARKMARMTESPVTLNVITDSPDGQHRVTVTLSERAKRRLSQPGMPEFLLDQNLALRSDQPSFEFDGRGIVSHPGNLTLFARNEESSQTILLVE